MIGDATDLFTRLKRLMPGGWFGQPGDTPVLDAVLKAPAKALSGIHDLYAYAKLQTRIATATGGWLDLVALDFFGGDLTRSTNQSDASFRAAILALLFRPRATRPAIRDILVALTGVEPRIFEPNRAADTGGYGVACGYGLAGGWGSMELRAQAFIDVVRPRPQGVPNISGYGAPAGGLNTASPIEWLEGVDAAGAVDAEIYAALDRARPVGVTLWTRIVSSFETDELTGGVSAFSDGALYSDGAFNTQPTALV